METERPTLKHQSSQDPTRSGASEKKRIEARIAAFNREAFEHSKSQCQRFST